MELREFLATVASSYNRLDGLKTPTQALLRRASEELAEVTPAGITVLGSGGKGMATYTPWVGFFNPDETSDPQEGVYVVYLFAEDLRSVTLTLNQGMEYLRKRVGDKAARDRLARDARTLRDSFPNGALADLDQAIALASNGTRQRNYEAGNIGARRYDATALPSNAALEADLDRFLRLYDEVLDAKRQLLLGSPGSIASPTGASNGRSPDPLHAFKPKSDADYEAHLFGRKLRKSRRHETLIARYGEWAMEQGFHASTTEHPKDLVLRRSPSSSGTGTARH